MLSFFDAIDADVFCVQETRAHPEQVELEIPGYELFWNSAEKKGYSGTAVFTRLPVIRTWNGLGIERHDNEGRVISVEFEEFYLVNVYTPNAQNKLARLSYRTEDWDVCFKDHLVNLEQSKPVVVCGDLNVAHKEIDIHDAVGNVKIAGFTPEERRSFDRLVAAGFVDSFREFNRDPGWYTWWPYYRNARERNNGWRIDYFLVSAALKPRLRNARIHTEIMGSDHCPVSMELD